MGITNLLQTLQPCTKKINISEYSGQKVAVDAYCWLHKAAYSCSSDLCQGIPTNAYISYCVSFLKMMQYHKITPVVVFDGGRLPSKGATEEDRRAKRELNKTKGMEYLREGNVTAATSCFQRGVDITPQMAYNLIKVLRQMKIEYIVAPFEADAQLAFLAVNHFVHAVVTEDSDLVAYGCPRVLFKMDKMGNGQEVRINDVFLCKNPSFINWSQQMFLHMCILCGCDFLDSLPGVGPKKAHTLIKKYRDIDKVLVALRSELAMKMPPDFEIDFRKAELTFLHQRVWDPAKQAVVHLTELTEELAELDLSFLGQEIDKETGYLIANGEIDPHSRKPFEDQVPVNLRAKSFSFQSTSFSAKLKAANMLPTQKSTIPNYFLKGSTASNKPFIPPVKSNSQNSSSDEDKPLPPPASPPRSTKQEDDILAPETPPTQKKRIVISRFWNGAPGSPKVTNPNYSNDPQQLNEVDSLNDSVEKTPTKTNGVNHKLGNSPDKPITFDDDDDDVSTTISGNGKWSGFDNGDFADTSARVENDTLVYASSSKRTGSNQTRAAMPYAPVPQINNARISTTRLSLSNEKSRAANEVKRSEIHNRFGGFLQQFAFGPSSPSSPTSSTFSSTSEHPSEHPSDPSRSTHAFPHSSNSYSSESVSYSSESNSSEPNADDLNFVADSQEDPQKSQSQNTSPPDLQNPPNLQTPPNPPNLQTPPNLDNLQAPQKTTPTPKKKFLFKIDDEDDLLSLPSYDSANINLQFFKQRNSNGKISSPETPAIKPNLLSPSTPSSRPISSSASAIPTPSFSASKPTPSFTSSIPTPTMPSSKPTPSFPPSHTPSFTSSNSSSFTPSNSSFTPSTYSTKTPSSNFGNNSHKPNLASTYLEPVDPNLDTIGDSPTQPVSVSKRALFGDLCIGDSDNSGDERKHPSGTKRKIKASTLLGDFPSSPDELSFKSSRKLTPQTLFGRDDVDEMLGSPHGIKKMRLEPHSLLRQENGEDASDSLSGKKDHALQFRDKPLADTDLSASPSSKHTPPSPSPPPSPSLSRSHSHSRLHPNPPSVSSPLSSKTDAGDDLLSSHDFLDQFRFSGVSGATYIPSTTRQFLTQSSSPSGSPNKPRLNRSSSKSSFSASKSSFSASKSTFSASKSSFSASKSSFPSSSSSSSFSSTTIVID